MKTKERIEELEAQVEHLTYRVDRLADNVNGDGFMSKLAYAIQEVLNTHQYIQVRHYINDQEVNTKLIKEKSRELEQKKGDLERLLKEIDECLEHDGRD